MDPTAPFDRSAVRRHRDRAAPRVGVVADLLRDLGERLLDRLDDTTRRFEQALDLGGRGVVAPLLRARGIATVSCDLSERMAALNPPPRVVADEEFLPFAPGSFDLAVASLSLHWVNDLPGVLIQIRRALRPGGLLLASLPALGTLSELRTALTGAEADLTGGAAPRISPFPDLRDCAGLLQRAGYALPVADVEDIVARVCRPAAAACGAARGGRKQRAGRPRPADPAPDAVSRRPGAPAARRGAGDGAAAACGADRLGTRRIAQNTSGSMPYPYMFDNRQL